MTTQTASAATVLALFPGVSIGADGLFLSQSNHMNCDPQGAGHHVLDGSFTLDHLLAFGYWLINLPEFAEADADELAAQDLATTVASIQALHGMSAAEVCNIFPEAELDCEEFQLYTTHYVDCSLATGLHLIDGVFTNKEVLALLYWLTHSAEFKEPV